MEPGSIAPRHRAMRTHLPARPRVAPSTLLVVALVAALTAACGGPASSPASTPTPAPAATPEAAVAAVRAFTPLFDGLTARDPNMIGQGSWWEASPLDGASPPAGWSVTFTVGWGDCPSGCIDSHTWTWIVAKDGRTPFQDETGSVVTPDVLAARNGASTVTGVGGRVSAGPTCPVEQPGDPACAPRMVGGAVLVVQGAGGSEVARFTTDGSGLFRVALQPGDYTLVPQPVEGLMGTAAPMPFAVGQGAQTWLEVSYDTGIR